MRCNIGRLKQRSLIANLSGLLGPRLLPCSIVTDWEDGRLIRIKCSCGQLRRKYRETAIPKGPAHFGQTRSLQRLLHQEQGALPCIVARAAGAAASALLPKALHAQSADRRR